jgi:hypothetical protein
LHFASGLSLSGIAPNNVELVKQLATELSWPVPCDLVCRLPIFTYTLMPLILESRFGALAPL